MTDNVFAGMRLITPPTTEPLSLTDVNNFLRLQPVGVDTDADTYLTTAITAVRSHIENAILRKALLTQTWEIYLTSWPGRDYVNMQEYSAGAKEYYKYNHIKIPMPPLQVVNSISYVTSGGVTKSITPVDPPVSTQTQQFVNVYKNVWPAKLVLPFSGIWPTDVLMPGPAITINFTCGFQRLTDTSPASGQTILSNWEGFGPLIQGMKLILADCWENKIPAPDIASNELFNVVAKWLQSYRLFE